MQITAEVPLNLYRTPSKTVRATIQKKFFNIYVHIYFYAVQIGSRVRRGGETGIITKKNFNCNHFEVTDVAIREHCNVVKCVKGNIPFT